MNISSYAPLFTFFLCIGFVGENAFAEKSPTSVIVTTATQIEISETILYPARVESKIQAGIAAPHDGIITTILAPLGTSVREGQSILKLKNTDPVFQYVAVNIEAPVTGVISTVDVSIGSRVVRGQTLFTITDPSQPRIVVEVPAADLSSIRTGLVGSLSLASVGQEIPVNVIGVSPLVDAASGTSTAQLDVSYASTLPLGMVGRVRFTLNKRQVLCIPEQALTYRGKETIVQTVVDNRAKFVSVILGDTRKGMVEIKSGLQEGDLVITRASGFVTDGQSVEVQKSEEKKP